MQRCPSGSFLPAADPRDCQFASAWRLPSNNMTALAMANRQPLTVYPNG
jgi:hypothetical protein